MIVGDHRFDDFVRVAHAAFPVVPVPIIKAVIAQESRYDPRAIRGEPHLADASRGLMQLLYGTAKTLGYGGGAEGLFDPGVSTYYGTKLLAENFARAGNWPAAISAYNGGFRPSLGFGSKATAPVRVCLARDDRGVCLKWRDVKVGEFGNQEHVDRVMAFARQYEGESLAVAGSSADEPRGRADLAVLVVVVVVGLVALAVGVVAV